MELYVTEISKYVIALALLLYTVMAFLTFKYTTEKKRRLIYALQIVFMFSVQLACFIQIASKSGKPVYVFFFAFQVIIFASVLMLFYVIYPEGNRLIINNSCMLLMIGTRVEYGLIDWLEVSP